MKSTRRENSWVGKLTINGEEKKEKDFKRNKTNKRTEEIPEPVPEYEVLEEEEEEEESNLYDHSKNATLPLRRRPSRN